MNNIKSITAIVISAVFVSIALVVPAQAETNSGAISQGLRISPALVELNAVPGKTYEINLTVTNVTTSNVQFDSLISDFSAKDETGVPKIFQDNSLPESSSIKSWVNVENTFVLSSQQQKKITAKVTIPDNAEPGGHYGSLSFTGRSSELDGNGVGLSASAGTLILVRVDGEITEKADVAEFFATKNDKPGSLFESGPISLVARIKNDGNIHVKPSGTIEVRDISGNLVQNIDINVDKKSSILPKSIRRFESKIDKSFMLGKYTASLALGYGQNGQAITATYDFWVIPYRMILVILISVVLAFIILSRLIKRYNSHVISKSKNSENGKQKHKKTKHKK